ncbi:MAG: hypothetical protein ACLFTO_02110 [Candidatus Acetothermia bacterium]
MSEEVYAEVAVFRPIPNRFEYLVPEVLEGEITTGSICSVPFRGETERAVVTELRKEASFPGEKKRLEGVLSEKPLEKNLLELARVLEANTFTPLGQVFKRMVPSDLSVKPRSEKSVRLTASFDEVRDFLENSGSLAPKQATLLEGLLTADGPIEKTELLDKAGSSRSPLKSLEEKGFVEEVSVPEVGREEVSVPKGAASLEPDPDLTRALVGLRGSNEVRSLYSPGKERLASYLESIRILAGDGSVLVLTPDVSRAKEFSGLVDRELDLLTVTYHSELTKGETAYRWKLARTGRVDVFVGVLSAVYLPLPDLGGIIIEDEGSRNYELKEQDPKGNLVEIAQERGRLEEVPVIQGGRVPSINSYYRLRKGRLKTLGPGASYFPENKVDLRLEESDSFPSDSPLTDNFLGDLKRNYEDGNPALIIGERAGPSNAAICRDCGDVLRCPSCGVPLAFRSQGSYGVCPYCGEKEDIMECPSCGSDEVRFIGGGLKEVKEELGTYLPAARVRSYDPREDERSFLSSAVRDLRRGEIDILLGTSLVGSLFFRGWVPLVGLMDVNLLLNRPTYRSTELFLKRLFLGYDLVRPGGRIYLQGARPRQAPFGMVKSKGWRELYERELESRETMDYPPYRGLLEIEIREGEGQQGSLIDGLKRELGRMSSVLTVLGPREEEDRLEGSGRRSYLMVKTEDHEGTLESLAAIVPRSERRGIRLNPYL